MEAGREFYWNIPLEGLVLYPLSVVATAFMIYVMVKTVKRWHVGQPEARGAPWGQRIWSFLVAVVMDGLLHRRFMRYADGIGNGFGLARMAPRELTAGFAHWLIFLGCLSFLVATTLGSLSHYTVHFMKGNFYLVFSAVIDVFGILVIIGIALALIRRYGARPKRLDNKPEDLIALLLIFVVVISGFIVEGLRIAATSLQTNPDWASWSVGGYALALAFQGASDAALAVGHSVWWWLHMASAVGAIVYVSLFHSKLFHIIWDPVNIFFRDLGPKGKLQTIDFEAAEDFGVSTIEQFTWKQLLDLDACTRCGRCQDACPANASGKALNPKQLIQDLKTHYYEMHPLPFVGGKAPETRRDMISEVVTEEVIWDCTTCRACVDACPVYVEHVDKIIGMRRNLTMERSQLPESAQDALKCLSTRWHPFRGTTQGRTDWADGLDVTVLADDSDVELLYWVGCTAALEERNMKVARAFAKVTQAAGVKFGILGDEEMCCGDPARRMGDEYLYQTLAQQNVEILNGYGVKKIVTACPHCFNTLKFEYSDFEGKFEVIHHAEFINTLIKDGRINPIQLDLSRFTYHDSCYLGRYNNIYGAPRDVLQAVGRGDRVELPRAFNNSFCCGGGAGHMWMEEEPETRISSHRVAEVVEADVSLLATACPYCLVMFEDAVKAKGVEETLRTRDLAELVADAITLPAKSEA